MVLATIQGKNKEISSITALNGELIYDEKQQEYINKLIDILHENKVMYRKKQEIRKIRDKFVAFLEHSEADDIGRIRTAIVLYDKNTPKKEINKTLEAIGLNIDSFDLLLSKYKKRQMIINGAIIIVIAGVVILFKKSL